MHHIASYCIVLHHFFDFFDASPRGKARPTMCGKNGARSLANHNRATRKLVPSDLRCTKMHHFFDFSAFSPTD
jgi:hypothetical protein